MVSGVGEVDLVIVQGEGVQKLVEVQVIFGRIEGKKFVFVLGPIQHGISHNIQLQGGEGP